MAGASLQRPAPAFVDAKTASPAAPESIRGRFEATIVLKATNAQIAHGSIWGGVAGGGWLAPLGRVRVTGMAEGTDGSVTSPGHLTLIGSQGRVILTFAPFPPLANTPQ